MNKPVFLRIIFYFISSRLIFLLLAIIASYLIPLREGYLGSQFDAKVPYLAWVWANFDGRHFLSIVTEGYKQTNFAYFPLYPLLISLTGYIFPISHLLLGIFISVVFYFSAMLVIFKIIRLDYEQKVANLSLLLLSFFPLSFFYHSVYTDSVFLFLTVSSFYFARKGKWWLSGLLCGLAMTTRLSGIALLPALLVEWYLQNKNLGAAKLKLRFLQTGLPVLVLGCLGIFSYLLYLQVYFGDLLLFQKSMIAWKQNEFVFPLQVVWRYVKIFFSVSPSLLVFWIAILEFITLVIYSATALYVLIRVRVSYGVFMLLLLSLVTFTGTFAGTPRYALHLFPLFLGLAVILFRRKTLRYLTYFLFLFLGLILTALFTRGYFVA